MFKLIEDCFSVAFYLKDLFRVTGGVVKDAPGIKKRSINVKKIPQAKGKSSSHVLIRNTVAALSHSVRNSG